MVSDYFSAAVRKIKKDLQMSDFSASAIKLKGTYHGDQRMSGYLRHTESTDICALDIEHDMVRFAEGRKNRYKLATTRVNGAVNGAGRHGGLIRAAGWLRDGAAAA